MVSVLESAVYRRLSVTSLPVLLYVSDRGDRCTYTEWPTRSIASRLSFTEGCPQFLREERCRPKPQT